MTSVQFVSLLIGTEMNSIVIWCFAHFGKEMGEKSKNKKIEKDYACACVRKRKDQRQWERDIGPGILPSRCLAILHYFCLSPFHRAPLLYHVPQPHPLLIYTHVCAHVHVGGTQCDVLPFWLMHYCSYLTLCLRLTFPSVTSKHLDLSFFQWKMHLFCENQPSVLIMSKLSYIHIFMGTFIPHKGIQTHTLYL